VTSEDIVLVAALGVALASVAYLLVTRSTAAPELATRRGTSPPRGFERSEASSETPASSGKGPSSVPAPSGGGLSGSPSAVGESGKSASGGLERLYSEDDDDVDPTRVGAKAAGKSKTTYQPPLKRITYDEGAEQDEPTLNRSVFLVHAAAQTDKGLRRKRNEDSVLVLDAENLFVIADGMGGYQGGQLASQTAVKTIERAFLEQTFDGPPHDGVAIDVTNLARAIQMANAAILDIAQEQPELEGMGTTICAARFSPNKKRLFIGHVGDSRCYRLREGVLSQMTADHTMADFGVTGPESGQLSRAVGVWPTVPIDIVTAAPLFEDVYLLCSDGLTKMLPDETIGVVLRAEDDPKIAVERLIYLANARGGKDNITVVLVRVVPPDWRPRDSSHSE
jgi:PPM family protein phosphatase